MDERDRWNLNLNMLAYIAIPAAIYGAFRLLFHLFGT
jgi:hypothetical protein